MFWEYKFGNTGKDRVCENRHAGLETKPAANIVLHSKLILADSAGGYTKKIPRANLEVKG